LWGLKRKERKAKSRDLKKREETLKKLVGLNAPSLSTKRKGTQVDRAERGKKMFVRKAGKKKGGRR